MPNILYIPCCVNWVLFSVLNSALFYAPRTYYYRLKSEGLDKKLTTMAQQKMAECSIISQNTKLEGYVQQVQNFAIDCWNVAKAAVHDTHEAIWTAFYKTIFIISLITATALIASFPTGSFGTTILLAVSFLVCICIAYHVGFHYGRQKAK